MAFDEVKKAVVKATSLEHGPPKEKHVQYMLQAIKDGHGSSAREILLEVGVDRVVIECCCSVAGVSLECCQRLARVLRRTGQHRPQDPLESVCTFIHSLFFFQPHAGHAATPKQGRDHRCVLLVCC